MSLYLNEFQLYFVVMSTIVEQGYYYRLFLDFTVKYFTFTYYF